MVGIVISGVGVAGAVVGVGAGVGVSSDCVLCVSSCVTGWLVGVGSEIMTLVVGVAVGVVVTVGVSIFVGESVGVLPLFPWFASCVGALFEVVFEAVSPFPAKSSSVDEQRSNNAIKQQSIAICLFLSC